MTFYWPTIEGFFAMKLSSKEDVEDLSIATFSKAFDKIETFDERYTFGTWLITISKNIHIDKTRKKNASIYSRTTSVIEDQVNKIIDGSPTPEDILISEQNLAELLRYIKILKPLSITERFHHYLAISFNSVAIHYNVVL